MQRLLLCSALALGVLAVPSAAYAGQVAPSSRRVVGAGTGVTGCGALTGIGVAWTSTDNVVTELRLTAIPAGCVGARLSVTLAGAAGVSLASFTPVTASTTSLVLTPGGSPAATSVTGVYLSAAGP